MFVKICGTTSLDDACLAIDCGADAVGFVMAASKRHIEPAEVAAIVRGLSTRQTGGRDREVETVAVMDASEHEGAETIVSAVRQSQAGVLQLHRPTETILADCVKALGETHEVIPAFSELPGYDMAPYATGGRVLVDGPRPGSGQSFDWNALDASRLSGLRLIIAGGLNASNVADAIRTTRCYGVDVVSGVEGVVAGRKDPARLRAFIEEARNA